MIVASKRRLSRIVCHHFEIHSIDLWTIAIRLVSLTGLRVRQTYGPQDVEEDASIIRPRKSSPTPQGAFG